ncbi:MAG TPA: hypothetical protein VG325_15470 [Solirubrobacteraceae bacterium]|nr:hypothetical protein [Solirubrobacteraceae bacterium]
MDLRCLGISLGRAGHAEAALELMELIRLHEEQTGRPGNISGAVEMLQDSRARSLEPWRCSSILAPAPSNGPVPTPSRPRLPAPVPYPRLSVSSGRSS